MFMNFFTKLFSNINQYKILWFLIQIYVLLIVMSNWFDARLIDLLGIATTSGTLIYPLTLVINNIITEVYGYKFARKCIYFGFIFNLIMIGYGYLIIHIPAPNFALQDARMFNHIFSISALVTIASFISYWISEPLNSFINARLKIASKGKYMALRFFTSTLFSTFFDSFVFVFIAFFSLYSFSNLIDIVLSMWFIKVIVEGCSLIISVPLAYKLKKVEKLDRFDIGTKFSIFSLESKYSAQTNAYIKK